MNVKFNVNNFNSQLDNKIKNIDNAKTQVIIKAVKYAMYNAQRLAPAKKGGQGETKQGFRIQKVKPYHYKLINHVKGHKYFKQNLWANRSEGFSRPRMVWNNRKPTLYGDGSHTITGTPQFFDKGVKLAQDKFKGIVVRDIGVALNT